MTWLIKGREISFDMDDGETLSLPIEFGMIHSPDTNRRCSVYFGPYKRTREAVSQLPRIASLYFGSDYDGRVAYIDIPSGAWRPVGKVDVIFYDRPGEHRDYYRHQFEKPVPLSANGRFHRLSLPSGCVVNDRGFVSP
jgi:hypothetical protein